ncbi:MAG: ATP-dependent helicase [Candidatus Berkelbacteria bacterium]|nr:ATP-dependent helicase [Candidatus Berkelbacteria bacterium]
MDLFKGLNANQTRAIKCTHGPCLIVAGAGTGKTTVITRKIAYLIAQKIAEPAEILALTFTEKAAQEMEERVDQLVPYGFTDTNISTFHSFGDRLIRDYAIELSLPANFNVLTDTERAIFFRQNLYAFKLKHFRPPNNPTSFIEAMLNHFSRLKDELVEPEEYIGLARKKYQLAKKKKSTQEELVEAERTLELVISYEKYNQLMIQNGNLDFGDQLFLTHKLLKENTRVLKECQEKYKFILVDEFQDTNFAQNEIVKLLAKKHLNITVVGDDDQSIYRFRGAAISNILDFIKTYPRAKQIVLNKNYRSTQEILDAAYKLIQHNNPDRLEVKNKLNKKLLALKNGSEPELIFCNTLSCEADKTISKIAELKKKGLSYNDFAILIRSNSQAEPFIQSLNLAGIPYLFSGKTDLYSHPEIKMLVSFLKCLVYDDDNLSFYQLAASELYSVPDEIMSRLYTQAKRKNRAIREIICVDRSPGHRKLRILISDLENYRKLKSEPVGEVLYRFLTEKKYLNKLSKETTAENELKMSRIARFFDRINEFNHASRERGVLAFLENLELILEFENEVATPEIDPDLDVVNILTVHGAKGLEWKAVFIVNCVSERFPSRNLRDQLPIPEEFIKERLPVGDYHLQEERRLFYVGTTRAKDYLFLTAAEDYGGKRSKKLSRFVLEFFDEPNPQKLTHKLSPYERIERFKKAGGATQNLPKKFTQETLRLSRQQIDDYFTCPKKFYYVNILNIPLLENHALMYGTAIHAALSHYYLRKIAKKKVSFDQLTSDFIAAFNNVGFISREQEEERKRSGIETLTRFYEEDIKNNLVPSAVEERFEFSEGKVKVNGRYDIVLGSKDSVEIVDFKTSRVTEQKEADRRIKESTQMMIYALAYWQKYSRMPKTTLYFIESGLKGENIFQDKDLAKTKEMIREVEMGIRSNNMKAKPNKRSCRDCPFKDICPEAIL